MEEREKLEKMDLLRTRFNVPYARAREVLESTGWDAVAAAVQLEQEEKGQNRGFTEELKVTGADLVETLKRLLHEGNVNRIIVRDGRGTELLNMPINGVLVVTLVLPILTALGAVVAVAMDYTVVVERNG